MAKVRMKEADFAKAYAKACKSQLTREEFAASIGMPVESVTSKISQFKKRVIEGGMPEEKFPTLKGSNRKRVKIDKREVAANFAALLSDDEDEIDDVSDVDDVDDNEVDAETEEAVNS